MILAPHEAAFEDLCAALDARTRVPLAAVVALGGDGLAQAWHACRSVLWVVYLGYLIDPAAVASVCDLVVGLALAESRYLAQLDAIRAGDVTTSQRLRGFVWPGEGCALIACSDDAAADAPCVLMERMTPGAPDIVVLRENAAAYALENMLGARHPPAAHPEQAALCLVAALRGAYRHAGYAAAPGNRHVAAGEIYALVNASVRAMVPLPALADLVSLANARAAAT